MGPAGFDPPCMEALDVDDSGTIDTADPINNLIFQFAGAFTIPPPGYIVCSEDPSEDELSCQRYDSCDP